MSRIRLTARVITANPYESLLNKLKKEYPDKIQEAAKYKCGESGGFVFHHANFRTDNMLPTTDFKGNRKEQSQYINKVIDYSRLKTDSSRETFLESLLPGGDEKAWKELDRRLREDKKKLDDEMNGVFLIPNRFHGYLHSSAGDSILHARNPKELYQQFLIYLGTLNVEKYLKLIDKARGNITDSIDAIKHVTDFLLFNKRKEEAKNITEKALDRAKGILKDLNRRR